MRKFLPVTLTMAALAVTLVGAPAQAAPTFTVVSAPAAIAAQPGPETGSGARIIQDLGVQNGKVYMGYGDWTTNTGPIDVIAYNTFTGATTTELDNVPTEAITTYRTIDGALYVPWIDPVGGGSGTYSTNAGGTWKNVYGPFGEHWFDITKNGSTLLVAGSRGGVGAVTYASRDGGQTWTLEVSDANNPYNGWERYYWAATVGGKTYVQARDTSHAWPARVFDGARWSTKPLNAIGHPTSHLVEAYKDSIFSPTYSLIRGKQVYTGIPGTGIEDFFQYNGLLYALTDSGVYSTDGSLAKGRNAGGVVWTLRGTPPTDAESLAVVNGVGYFGMRDGTLVRSSEDL